MDSQKIQAVLDWQIAKDVQSFLDFANFYRKFIPHFAHNVKPLTQLLKKESNLLGQSLHSKLHLKS